MPTINISDIVAVPHLEKFSSMLPHQCDHGGRAAYKSSKNAIKIAKLTIVNPTIEVIVFRQDYSDHKNSTFRDLIWAYEELGIILKPGKHYPMGNDLWIKLPQGNYIHFKQMKQKDKLKGYRPTKPSNTINIAWFFEITEYKEESYIVSARSSVMREAGEWFICLYEWNNAPKLSNWTYDFMHTMGLREDAYVKKTNYCDAPEWQQKDFLGLPLLKEIEMLKLYSPEQYKSEYLGFPANLTGTVYKQFDRERNLKAPSEQYVDITIGVDFGGNDATVCTAIGFLPNYNGIEVIDTYYHKNGITGGVKNINDYAKDIMEFCKKIHDKYNMTLTLFLDTANNTTMGMLLDDYTYTEEYKYVIMGYLNKIKKRTGTNKKKSAIQERVDITEIMLGAGYLTINPLCTQLVKAIEQCEYDKNGDRKDDGTSDIDSLDSLEYSWLMEMQIINDTILK